MTALVYLTPGWERMIAVRTIDNNARPYSLALFSRNGRGYDSWDEVRKHSTDQLNLP